MDGGWRPRSRAPPPESARDGQLVDAEHSLRALAEPRGDPRGPVFLRDQAARMALQAGVGDRTEPSAEAEGAEVELHVRILLRVPHPVAPCIQCPEIDDGVVAAEPADPCVRLPGPPPGRGARTGASGG